MTGSPKVKVAKKKRVRNRIKVKRNSNRIKNRRSKKRIKNSNNKMMMKMRIMKMNAKIKITVKPMRNNKIFTQTKPRTTNMQTNQTQNKLNQKLLVPNNDIN